MAAAGPIRSQAERRSPTGRPAVPGRGFSLVELLVVLGIFMLLMGLSVAAIVSRPRTDAMVAAEQALGDAIRQARHTARTTGQPVVLRLKQAERQIAGLVREPLWQGLEGWPKVRSGGNQVDVSGRTGTGLLLPDAYHTDGDPAQPLDPVASSANRMQLPGMGTQPLERQFRMWRGQAAGRQPIVLSLAVRPPVAGAGDPIIPLVMVGADKNPGDADFGAYEQAAMGLVLVQSDYQPGAGASGPKPATVSAAVSWEILGWLGDSTTRVEASSIHRSGAAATAGSAYQQNLDVTMIDSGVKAGGAITGTDVRNTGGFAESGPLIGGKWIELTLLYDGARLILYRDGIWLTEVDARAVTLPVVTAERVQVGLMTIGGGSLGVAKDCGFDDVRLERLGDAMAGTFPNGVAPTQDWRITCHPDGRVEILDVSTGTTTGTIALTSPSGTRAALTVDAMGGLSASTVSP